MMEEIYGMKVSPRELGFLEQLRFALMEVESIVRTRKLDGFSEHYSEAKEAAEWLEQHSAGLDTSNTKQHLDYINELIIAGEDFEPEDAEYINDDYRSATDYYYECQADNDYVYGSYTGE